MTPYPAWAQAPTAAHGEDRHEHSHEHRTRMVIELSAAREACARWESKVK